MRAGLAGMVVVGGIVFFELIWMFGLYESYADLAGVIVDNLCSVFMVGWMIAFELPPIRV